MMLDTGSIVAVKLGSVRVEPVGCLAPSKTLVGLVFSVLQVHRTLAVLCLVQELLLTMAPIGIKPLILFKHFIQPPPVALTDLTTIDYKLDVLMYLRTAEAHQLAVKYECCSQTDTPTRVQ